MARAVVDQEEFRQRADRSVLVLYATVAETIGWATAALLDQDVELADRLIADDRKFDDSCSEVIGLIKDRLAESDVEPDELEDLIAILQMVPELERSADLSEHIAQRARQGLGGAISPRSRGIIQSMCDAGIRMWQLSTRAYAERSRDLSFEISESDDELDNLSAALLREGAAGGVEPGVAAELALIARFYERLGDHAVNLARRSAAMGAPRRMSSIRSLRRRRGDSPDGSSWTSLAGRFRRLRVLPGDSEFFELFSEAASIAHQGAEAMLDMVSSVDAIDEQYQHIRSLERQGDEVAVQVARRLDATFITPYDREDIHALAEELDDVIDEIFAAAALIQAVRVESFLPEVKQQAETLAKMGAELRALIAGLQTREGVKHRLERIEELEREGDAIHRRCMTSLFSGAFDALDVIKWKDIVQAMENAMNKVEDVSDVVEAILVKQS